MADIYQIITDKIISAIETAQTRNEKQWLGQGTPRMPANFQTRRAYSGINALVLLVTAQSSGYTSPLWMTFKQATAGGGTIKKGEHGTQIVFFDIKEREETDKETGEIGIKKSALLKSYVVFNLDQTEGITAPEVLSDFQGIEAADVVLTRSGASITEAGTRAFYSPSHDLITLPARARFVSSEAFYAVALHELTHWTGHKARLARDFSGRFGTESYAMEELVAELGAAFLCADIGLIPATLEDHAGYIENWLKVLKSDKKAIFSAAAAAAKAHSFVMALAAEEAKQAA